MSQVGLQSKFEQLKGILAKDIESGNYCADDKFPSENVLAAKYRIGRSTVREALSSLVHEGLLYRIQGKGTFVAAATQKDSRICALFIKTQGHLYEHQSGILLRELQTRGYMTIVIDNELFGETEQQQIKFMRDLLKQGVSTFIIDGFYTFPMQILNRLKDELPHIIFMNRCEFPYAELAHYVLSDPAHGMKVAFKHLLQQGRKKIMFLTFDPATIAPSVSYDGYDYTWSDHYKFSESYLQCCRDSGAQAQRFYKEQGFGQLRNLLDSAERPDAIISYLDNMAEPVFEICRDLNISIPDDLAFIGYYNTPWCDMMPVSISSMSIQEDEIAKKVASLVCRKQKTACKVIVKPKLIVRKSG